MFAAETDATREVRRVLWQRHKRKIDDGQIALKAIRAITRMMIDPIREAQAGNTATVTQETWEADRIAALWSPITEGKPHSTDGALIVVRVNGTDILIDGHNRRAKRIAEDDRSPHAVLVIEV